MKLKKFLATVLSLSMVATSVISVSAAFEYAEEDGMIFISEMPTMAEVSGRTPSLAVNVEKLDNATFSTVDTVYNTQYAKKTDAETGAYLYDMYRVTYTFSNLGDLAVGYLESKSGIGFAGLKANATFLDKTEIKASKIKSSSVNSFTNEHGFDGTTLTIQSYTTAVANPYPFFGTEELGAINTATDFSLTALYAVNAGKKVDFTVTGASVSYIHLTNDVPELVPVDCTLPAETTLSLGSTPVTPDPEPAAELAVSATQVKDTETGYIWDVTLTKGATAPTAFDAKFTDSNDEIAERTIRNFADLVSAKLPEGTGSATFKVGLSTSRTLKAVEFKVTDAAGSATWTN